MQNKRDVSNLDPQLSSLYEYLIYEKYVENNPILPVRKRYLRRYKDNNEGQLRTLIMAKLINSTMDTGDKAMITLLAKTGIRRNELISLDAGDIDWVEQKIRLKPTHKRTKGMVFFDDEQHRFFTDGSGQERHAKEMDRQPFL